MVDKTEKNEETRDSDAPVDELGLRQSEMYHTTDTGIADVIAEIGIGLANAQRALDMNSIKTQNAILENEELFSSGMSATWYVIPEVTFSLKMEYSVTKENRQQGDGDILANRGRFMIVPSNAKYNNLFKTESMEESTLTLKIVPIPSPERVTERRFVPNFIGKTVVEAKELAESKGIFVSFDSEADDRTVRGQSCPEGTLALIGKSVKLTTGVKK